MLIVLLYHLSIFFVGLWFYKIFFSGLKNVLFSLITIITLGLLVSLPVTYAIACLLSSFNDPLFLSVSLFTSFSILLSWIKRKKIIKSVSIQRPSFTDVFVITMSLSVATYIMVKTFKVSSNGALQIARNAVFDFGHALSILRSMSWGQNIPYTSPFIAGTEHPYHFLFQFWSAILEHFGLPLFYAINIPSIIGFSLFLLVVYCIGKKVFGKTSIGLLAVIGCIFHGGLMFIPFFQRFGFNISSIIHNPNYLFAGPFDGSIYSLFFTLNVFVNQRHLGISLAFFFLIYFLFHHYLEEKKLSTPTIFMFALLVGMLTLWHLVLTAGLLVSLVLSLLLKRKWRDGFILFSNTIFISLLFIRPWLPYISRGVIHFFEGAKGSVTGSGGQSHPFWLLEFFMANYGVSLIFIIIGLFRYKKTTLLFLPMFLLVGIFMIINIPLGVIDQKFLNVFLVVTCLFAAAGIVYLAELNPKYTRVLYLGLPMLFISGIIDFMVIKNDYMFPVDLTVYGSIVSFIDQNTPKNAVFLSYEDIFDPVTLAGRKNYYGFFKIPASLLTESDNARADRIRNVFDVEDSESLRYAVADTGVDYIVLPPEDKKDFPYTVNRTLLEKTFPVVLDDFNHVILDVRE